MAQLTICNSCNRHVRVAEASCPFCEAALPLSGLSAQEASVRPIAGGLSRSQRLAAVAAFAAAPLVAACDEAEQTMPLYGAPVVVTGGEPSTGAAQESGGAVANGGTDAPSGSLSTGGQVQETGGTNVFPVYGAPIPEPDAGAPDAGSDTGPDAGPELDAGPEKDAGPIIIPLYGAAPPLPKE